MIERYTIKFGPAVSQKELQKAFEEGKELTPDHRLKLNLMKVRIEVVCDYADLKKLDDLIKTMAKEAAGDRESRQR
jgi:hypothetical protein